MNDGLASVRCRSRRPARAPVTGRVLVPVDRAVALPADVLVVPAVEPLRDVVAPLLPVDAGGVAPELAGFAGGGAGRAVEG